MMESEPFRWLGHSPAVRPRGRACDAEDGILAQPESMTDFPVGLTFADQLEHFGSESVCLDALTRPPAEHDAALACGRDA
jgi:hypothetical protein